MPRPREREGQTLDKNKTIRFSGPMLAFIDSRRGTRTLGHYIRDLVRADAERHTRIKGQQ
jgi:hypothetical protein